jgi:hypothetical protein
MPNCTLFIEVYGSLSYNNVHTCFLSLSEGTITFPKKTCSVLDNCIINRDSLETSNTAMNTTQFVIITCGMKVKNLESIQKFFTWIVNAFFFLSYPDPWYLNIAGVKRYYCTWSHSVRCSTPQDEWSARTTDHYFPKHNTHRRDAPVPAAEFEPAIPSRKRPQAYVLDCAATGIGC